MTTRNLLVTSQSDHTVREYDVSTGAFVRVAASGLGAPLDVVIGLDGNLLVSDGQANQVKRYDGGTGAFIDVFASTNLAGPTGMTIHQGVLYVTNSNSPQGVQKFDATTGVNIGGFVPSIANPSPRDVKVNPANNRLYVLYYNAATVETFDLATMASFGLLMPAGNPLGSGGLFTPSAMAFGPDGNLYISGGTFGGNLGVRRYNPTTGAFIDFFANTGSNLFVPIGITFGPDNNLYVSTQNAANVMRFNYPAGTFMDFFVPNGGGGLTAPFHLTFVAGPSILTYTLQRDCLHNANDPGMHWQIEGGKVLENGKARSQLLQREADELRNDGAEHSPAVGYAVLPRWEPAREHHPAWCPCFQERRRDRQCQRGVVGFFGANRKAVQTRRRYSDHWIAPSTQSSTPSRWQLR
jgi:streptogramin lyase